MPVRKQPINQAEEKTNLKIEILEKVSTLATAGLGLVAALAWNDAITAIFSQLFPKPGDNIWALVAYALFITIIIVIITLQLSRALNLAKKELSKGRHGRY